MPTKAQLLQENETLKELVSSGTVIQNCVFHASVSAKNAKAVIELAKAIQQTAKALQTGTCLKVIGK